jgi:hypothetical protein
MLCYSMFMGFVVHIVVLKYNTMINDNRISYVWNYYIIIKYSDVIFKISSYYSTFIIFYHHMIAVLYTDIMIYDMWYYDMI